VVLQWCYSGVTVVLHRFYSGVTMVLDYCNNQVVARKLVSSIASLRLKIADLEGYARVSIYSSVHVHVCMRGRARVRV
jgi:predicted transcriptional regulator YheO